MAAIPEPTGNASRSDLLIVVGREALPSLFAALVAGFLIAGVGGRRDDSIMLSSSRIPHVAIGSTTASLGSTVSIVGSLGLLGYSVPPAAPRPQWNVEWRPA